MMTFASQDQLNDFWTPIVGVVKSRRPNCKLLAVVQKQASPENSTWRA